MIHLRQLFSKIYSIGLVVILVFYLAGCKDIIEPDIKGNTVNLLSPVNGYNSQSASISFWWDEVKYATRYHLQVAKPDFTNVQALLLDSNITTNKFMYSFGSGPYQWRIRAENGSSQTVYTTRSFSIDSTLNLANQTISLVSPADNYVSKNYKQQLKWLLNTSSDDYRIEVLSGTSTIFTNATYTKDTLTYTFPGDGTYTWRVKGQNVQSSTPFASRTIVIDGSAPNTPLLISPADQDSTSFLVGIKSRAAISLSWNRGSATGTAITDSVLIYQAPATSTNIKTTTTNTTYTDSLAIGKYYWKVMSVDAVGNKSAYSTVRSFKVK